MKFNSLNEDKRGLGIQDLYPVIIIIATVAILLAIIMMVMTAWIGVTNTKTATITNESLTSVNISGVTVSNATRCGFDNFVVVRATNTSGNETISSGNYTTDADAGIIYAVDSAEYNNTLWDIVYTFNYGGDDCEAVEDIIGSYEDFVPWIGIILLVIAAAIVLGIVIHSFKKPRI